MNSYFQILMSSSSCKNATVLQDGKNPKCAPALKVPNRTRINNMKKSDVYYNFPSLLVLPLVCDTDVMYLWLTCDQFVIRLWPICGLFVIFLWPICEPLVALVLLAVTLKIVWNSLKRYMKFSLKLHGIVLKIAWNFLKNWVKFS